MSLKDLFESTKTTTSSSADKTAYEVESEAYVEAYITDKDTFVPSVDFSTASNFARYGSAEKYYVDSIERITNEYPYDGSRAEKVEFQNSSSYLDRWIFENRYPKSTGYVSIGTTSGSGGWSSMVSGSGEVGGWGMPNTSDSNILEYIEIKAGPHTGSADRTFEVQDVSLKKLYSFSNVYDSGSAREYNMEFDLRTGVTVEFWLLKNAFYASKTEREVIFDLWNNENSSSAGYGRLMIELTGGADAGSAIRLTAQSGTSGFVNQPIASITPSEIADGVWKHYAITLKNDPDDDGVNTKLFINGQVSGSAKLGSDALGRVTGSLTANLGALRAPPSGATGYYDSTTIAKGGAKLSASLDEFRYWKLQRDPKQIGRYWHTQIAGGTNTDVANVGLGVYYKFNEGVMHTSSRDTTVLDYSGRISNGWWRGGVSEVRNTGSAMTSGSHNGHEFHDPIIYRAHPEVGGLRSELASSGSLHDSRNPSKIAATFPSWVSEEGAEESETLSNLTQIMGSYFDKLHLQIEALGKLKDRYATSYTQNAYSASYKPIPFADKLVSQFGIATPELLQEAEFIEHFLNRNEKKEYAEKLSDTRNQIYSNIYANLLFIFKSKGTEKSFRNMLRCFGVDDEIVKLNVYADNSDYVFKDNRRSTANKTNYVSFAHTDRFGSTVYQAISMSVDGVYSNPHAAAYITGSASGSAFGAYNPQTIECEVFFPLKPEPDDVDEWYQDSFFTASLFGAMGTVESTTDTRFPTDDGVDLRVMAVKDQLESTRAYFQLSSSNLGVLTSSYYEDVYDDTRWNFAVRVKPSKYPWEDQISGSAAAATATFVGTAALSGEDGTNLILTNADGSTVTFHTDPTKNFGDTSSDAGDHTWIVNTGGDFSSAGIRKATQAFHIACLTAIAAGELDMTASPATDTGTQTSFALTHNTAGTDGNTAITLITGMTANGETSFAGGIDNPFDVEFYGVNVFTDMVQNEFLLTASVSEAVGKTFLSSSKRCYVGALRNNFTSSGEILHYSNVEVGNLRYWMSDVSDNVVLAHAMDESNYGVESPYKNVFLYQTAMSGVYVPQIETLALHWNFDNVTGSGDSPTDTANTNDAQFIVQDMSSGSAEHGDRYKESFSPQVGMQHLGVGDFFLDNKKNVVNTRYIPTAKTVLPEYLYSSDMVEIRKRDDEFFTRDTRPSKVVYAMEKSMYQTISEEMINMFATLKDFDNLIGEPVNRYRHEYKDLAKLRQLFFERMPNTPDLDKYVDYYKWVDGAISRFLEQLMPASAYSSEGLRTMVESHILERNKYQTKYPTMEFQGEPPIAGAEGINKLLYDYQRGRAPLAPISFIHAAGHGTGSAEMMDDNENCLWWSRRADREHPILAATALRATSGSANDLHYSGTLATRIAIFSASAQTFNRQYTTPYKYTTNKSTIVHGGINFDDNKKLDYVYPATVPFSPRPLDYHIYGGFPLGYLLAKDMDLDASPSASLPNCDTPTSSSYGGIVKREGYKVIDGWETFKSNAGGQSTNGTKTPNWESGSYTTFRGNLVMPFNVISSSQDDVCEGYTQVVDQDLTVFKGTGIAITNTASAGTYVHKVPGAWFEPPATTATKVGGLGRGVNLVNLHTDTYGEDKELPMQGPFTEKYVGGRRYRHADINDGTHTLQNREEGFLMLISTAMSYSDGVVHATSGGIGLTGPDYPYPHGPYPFAQGDATNWRPIGGRYYRDEMAKRPVNIRNIQMKTSSAGDYYLYPDYQNVGRHKVVNIFAGNSKGVTWPDPDDAARDVLYVSASIDGVGPVTGSVREDPDYSVNPFLFSGSNAKFTFSTYIWRLDCSIKSPIVQFGSALMGTDSSYGGWRLRIDSSDHLEIYLPTSTQAGGYKATAGATMAHWRVEDSLKLASDYSGSHLTDNEGWWHLAVTYDGTQGGTSGSSGFEIDTSAKPKVYLNGVAQTVSTQTAPAVHILPQTASHNFRNDSSNNPLSIAPAVVLGGEANGGNEFTGSLDEVTIWNRPLQQGEILELMGKGGYYTHPNTASGGPPFILRTNAYQTDTGSLLAWWRFGDHSSDHSLTSQGKNSVLFYDGRNEYSSDAYGDRWENDALYGIYNLTAAQNSTAATQFTYNTQVSTPATGTQDSFQVDYHNQIASGSARTIIGNYKKNYEVVHTVGRSVQRPFLRDNQSVRNILQTGSWSEIPSVIQSGLAANADLVRAMGANPTASFPYDSTNSIITLPATTHVETILTQKFMPGGSPDFYRVPSDPSNTVLEGARVIVSAVSGGAAGTDDKHVYMDFAVQNRESSSTNLDTIFANRFSAPGGPRNQSKGFLDLAAEEYSVYNAYPWRNLEVLGSSSGEYLDTHAQIHSSSDHPRLGLRSLRSMPAGKFGVESVYNQDTHIQDHSHDYDLTPSWHKVNRNPRWEHRAIAGDDHILDENGVRVELETNYEEKVVYDNAYITRPIPQNDFQYAWISASLAQSGSNSSMQNLGHGYHLDSLNYPTPTGSRPVDPILFISASTMGSALGSAGTHTASNDRAYRYWGIDSAIAENNNIVNTQHIPNVQHLNLNLREEQNNWLTDASGAVALGYFASGGILPADEKNVIDDGEMRPGGNQDSSRVHGGAYGSQILNLHQYVNSRLHHTAAALHGEDAGGGTEDDGLLGGGGHRFYDVDGFVGANAGVGGKTLYFREGNPESNFSYATGMYYTSTWHPDIIFLQGTKFGYRTYSTYGAGNTVAHSKGGPYSGIMGGVWQNRYMGTDIIPSYWTGSIDQATELEAAGGSTAANFRGLAHGSASYALNHSIAGIFNGLMWKRNGPFGYPTWRQIRGGEHILSRRMRKNNRYILVDPASDRVENPKPGFTGRRRNKSRMRGKDAVAAFRRLGHVKTPERTHHHYYIPVADRSAKAVLTTIQIGDLHATHLAHTTVYSTTEDLLYVKNTYQNNLRYFPVYNLNKDMDLQNFKNERTAYDDLYEMYTEKTDLGGNNAYTLVSLVWRMNIFPRAKNIGRKEVRMRPSFDVGYWADSPRMGKQDVDNYTALKSTYDPVGRRGYGHRHASFTFHRGENAPPAVPWLVSTLAGGAKGFVYDVDSERQDTTPFTQVGYLAPEASQWFDGEKIATQFSASIWPMDGCAPHDEDEPAMGYLRPYDPTNRQREHTMMNFDHHTSLNAAQFRASSSAMEPSLDFKHNYSNGTNLPTLKTFGAPGILQNQCTWFHNGHTLGWDVDQVGLERGPRGSEWQLSITKTDVADFPGSVIHITDHTGSVWRITIGSDATAQTDWVFDYDLPSGVLNDGDPGSIPVYDATCSIGVTGSTLEKSLYMRQSMMALLTGSSGTPLMNAGLEDDPVGWTPGPFMTQATASYYYQALVNPEQGWVAGPYRFGENGQSEAESLRLRLNFPTGSWDEHGQGYTSKGPGLSNTKIEYSQGASSDDVASSFTVTVVSVGQSGDRSPVCSSSVVPREFWTKLGAIWQFGEADYKERVVSMPAIGMSFAPSYARPHMLVSRDSYCSPSAGNPAFSRRFLFDGQHGSGSSMKSGSQAYGKGEGVGAFYSALDTKFATIPFTSSVAPKVRRFGNRITAQLTRSIGHQVEGLYVSDWQWRAPEQSGKSPFYANYADWFEDMRGKSQDRQILPEYRISDRIPYFVIDKQGRFKSRDGEWLSIHSTPGWDGGTGGPLTGSKHVARAGSPSATPQQKRKSATGYLETAEVIGAPPFTGEVTASFMSDYAVTAKAELFDAIHSKHVDIAQPYQLTLTCDALLKFLPYQGLYPQLRTVDLCKQFIDSYDEHVSFKSDLGIEDLPSSFVLMDSSGSTHRPTASYWHGGTPWFNHLQAQGGGVWGTYNASSLNEAKFFSDPLKSGYFFDIDSILDPTLPRVGGTGVTYPSGIETHGRNAAAAKRPFYGPFMAPGILFNTIKSGIAVDYPVLHRKLATTASVDRDGGRNYQIMNEYFDNRLPFETLVEPEKYLTNVPLIDMEPHPSASINSTASWDGQGDPLYKMMMHNFLAEVPNFFLANGTMQSFTSLPESHPAFGQVSAVVHNGAQVIPEYRMMVKVWKSQHATAPAVSPSASNHWKNHRGAWKGPKFRAHDGSFSGSLIALGVYEPCYYTDVVGLNARGRQGGYTNGTGEGVIYGAGSSETWVGDCGFGLGNPISDYQSPQGIDYTQAESQYPRPQSDAPETITMYSRPSAFGPPSAGGYAFQPELEWVYTGSAAPMSMSYDGGANTAASRGAHVPGSGSEQDGWDLATTCGKISDRLSTTYGMKDGTNGYNAPFTPPYYDGQAWALLTFKPTSTGKHYLDDIWENTTVNFLRYEFDYVSGAYGDWGTIGPQGYAMNVNAMQIDAAVNIKGKTQIKEVTYDALTGLPRTVSDSLSTDSRNAAWVIQTKFETPILHFGYGLTDNQTVPELSGSVSESCRHESNGYHHGYPGLCEPIGMWHQYGEIPSASQGIYLEIGDIPLQYTLYGTEMTIANPKWLHITGSPDWQAGCTANMTVHYDFDNGAFKLGAPDWDGVVSGTFNNALVAPGTTKGFLYGQGYRFSGSFSGSEKAYVVSRQTIENPDAVADGTLSRRGHQQYCRWRLMSTGSLAGIIADKTHLQIISADDGTILDTTWGTSLTRTAASQPGISGSMPCYERGFYITADVTGSNIISGSKHAGGYAGGPAFPTPAGVHTLGDSHALKTYLNRGYPGTSSARQRLMGIGRLTSSLCCEGPIPFRNYYDQWQHDVPNNPQVDKQALAGGYESSLHKNKRGVIPEEPHFSNNISTGSFGSALGASYFSQEYDNTRGDRTKDVGWNVVEPNHSDRNPHISASSAHYGPLVGGQIPANSFNKGDIPSGSIGVGRAEYICGYTGSTGRTPDATASYEEWATVSDGPLSGSGPRFPNGNAYRSIYSTGETSYQRWASDYYYAAADNVADTLASGSSAGADAGTGAGGEDSGVQGFHSDGYLSGLQDIYPLGMMGGFAINRSIGYKQNGSGSIQTGVHIPEQRGLHSSPCATKAWYSNPVHIANVRHQDMTHRDNMMTQMLQGWANPAINNTEILDAVCSPRTVPSGKFLPRSGIPALTRSLGSLVGFDPGAKKLGQLSEAKTVKEAVVAMPYIMIAGRRHFVQLNKDQVDRYYGRNDYTDVTFWAGMETGLSLEGTAKSPVSGLQVNIGQSVLRQISLLERYVLPPHLDFSRNETATPYAMYIFEYEHTFSAQDLSDMWQGLFPDSGKVMKQVTKSVTHDLNVLELLGAAADAAGTGVPPQIRFMIFKVKQRAKINYFGATADNRDDERFKFKFRTGQGAQAPDWSYNWPYDFFSLVETVKIDLAISLKNKKLVEGVELQDLSQVLTAAPAIPDFGVSTGSSATSETSIILEATRRTSMRSSTAAASSAAVSATWGSPSTGRRL